MPKIPVHINSLLRHGLTFLGGYIVEHGIVNSSTMEEDVGAVITLIGIGWAMVCRSKKQE